MATATPAMFAPRTRGGREGGDADGPGEQDHAAVEHPAKGGPQRRVPRAWGQPPEGEQIIRGKGHDGQVEQTHVEPVGPRPAHQDDVEQDDEHDAQGGYGHVAPAVLVSDRGKEQVAGNEHEARPAVHGVGGVVRLDHEVVDVLFVEAGKQHEGRRDERGRDDAACRRRRSVVAGRVGPRRLLRARLVCVAAKGECQYHTGGHHGDWQQRRGTPLDLEHVLQKDGGGTAESHAPRHGPARCGLQAHAEVDRPAYPAEEQGRGHGDAHVGGGVGPGRQQRRRAERKRAEDAAFDCATQARGYAGLPAQAVQQVSEDDAHLEGVVHELTMLRGQIPLAGMVASPSTQNCRNTKAPNRHASGRSRRAAPDAGADEV